MSTLLRSVFAVIFGYMVMMVVTVPLTLIAVKVFSAGSGHRSPVFLVYNMLASFVAVFLGGCVTGRIAASQRVRHGFMLALVTLMMAMISASHSKGGGPVWYEVLLIVTPPFFAVLGAKVIDREIKA
ncbi:hypothetical protein FTO74_05920 [Granulicella sp. WH15]|uniref:hypothetical protein n=1 Tax=Granulicella sp. WH15 TaxID=2602070 RepID=UPI0013669621|nr:hypothetical protein [Granulicella sp. WH15]QHN02957.1 hypothetical protein FTO74_05920 [Granulicella sp. WH15]